MISFIICYRDREEHLIKFVPHLRNIMRNQNYEIILVNQNDSEKFRRGNLLNEGAKLASGDILIFHDIDYLAPDETAYIIPDNIDVWNPIKYVKFVDNNMQPRPENDIPSGYRHFKDGVDDNFFGGITCFRKDAFFKINGYNSLYNGWGLEDADLRERINHYQLNVGRGNSTFLALPHADSFPGLEDAAFQENQKLFQNWKQYLQYGVNTSFATITNRPDKTAFSGVDHWLDASNWVTVTPDLLPYMTVNNITKWYENTPEKHTQIWKSFKTLVMASPALKQHRLWVDHNKWGYGNLAFWWNFNLLIKEAPKNFKFLEIGVFKGAIISLVSMLNIIHTKEGKVFGITPLSNVDDNYSKHPDIDYETAIQQIYGQFGLSGEDLELIQGLSETPAIIEYAEQQGPYNIIYIDGGHDYETVVSDIQHYGKMVASGGYLILDDASNDLNIPDGLIYMDWRGLPDVTKAVNDILDKDPSFIFRYAVGHNKIYQKVQ